MQINHHFLRMSKIMISKPRVVRRLRGPVPTKPGYTRRYAAYSSLILSEAITRNVDSSVSMQTEKPQVD